MKKFCQDWRKAEGTVPSMNVLCWVISSQYSTMVVCQESVMEFLPLMKQILTIWSPSVSNQPVIQVTGNIHIRGEKVPNESELIPLVSRLRHFLSSCILMISRRVCLCSIGWLQQYIQTWRKNFFTLQNAINNAIDWWHKSPRDSCVIWVWAQDSFVSEWLHACTTGFIPASSPALLLPPCQSLANLVLSHCKLFQTVSQLGLPQGMLHLYGVSTLYCHHPSWLYQMRLLQTGSLSQQYSYEIFIQKIFFNSCKILTIKMWLTQVHLYIRFSPKDIWFTYQYICIWHLIYKKYM